MKVCEESVQHIWSDLDRDFELRTGYRAGWRDALRWVLSEYSIDIEEAYKHFPYIKEELKGE